MSQDNCQLAAVQVNDDQRRKEEDTNQSAMATGNGKTDDVGGEAPLGDLASFVVSPTGGNITDNMSFDGFASGEFTDYHQRRFPRVVDGTKPPEVAQQQQQGSRRASRRKPPPSKSKEVKRKTTTQQSPPAGSSNAQSTSMSPASLQSPLPPPPSAFNKEEHQSSGVGSATKKTAQSVRSSWQSGSSTTVQGGSVAGGATTPPSFYCYSSQEDDSDDDGDTGSGVLGANDSTSSANNVVSQTTVSNKAHHKLFFPRSSSESMFLTQLALQQQQNEEMNRTPIKAAEVVPKSFGREQQLPQQLFLTPSSATEECVPDVDQHITHDGQTFSPMGSPQASSAPTVGVASTAATTTTQPQNGSCSNSLASSLSVFPSTAPSTIAGGGAQNKIQSPPVSTHPQPTSGQESLQQQQQLSSGAPGLGARMASSSCNASRVGGGGSSTPITSYFEDAEAALKMFQQYEYRRPKLYPKSYGSGAGGGRISGRRSGGGGRGSPKQQRGSLRSGQHGFLVTGNESAEDALFDQRRHDKCFMKKKKIESCFYFFLVVILFVCFAQFLHSVESADDSSTSALLQLKHQPHDPTPESRHEAPHASQGNAQQKEAFSLQNGETSLKDDQEEKKHEDDDDPYANSPPPHTKTEGMSFFTDFVIFCGFFGVLLTWNFKRLFS